MSLAALTPEIVTLSEAQDYLRDLGASNEGNADNLQRVINGTTQWAYELTERKRLLDDDSSITEYRDGDGTSSLFTHEWPITSLDAVTLYPHDSGLLKAIIGPGTSVSNDEIVVDQPNGEILLQEDVFPDGKQTAVLAYKAGYTVDGNEHEGIKLALLQIVQMQWQKFIEKPGIIQTREMDTQRWTFKSDAAIRKEAMRLLRPWRRLHW